MDHAWVGGRAIVALAIGAVVSGCSKTAPSTPGPSTSSAAPAVVGSGAAVNAPDDCPGAFATAGPRAGVNEGFEVEGRSRRFFLRLPAADSLTTPRPLLVFFHGTNGSGDVIDRFPFADRLVEHGFVVVAPYGEDLGTVWPEWDAMRTADDRTRPNPDMRFFDRLVGCLRAKLPIAAERIYVAGMSAGGIMSNRVLRERSSLLAGGVVGSGIFDLTEPASGAKLEPMAVVVTTGGDNDAWGGENAGKELPSISFAEQAALAAHFYEEAPGGYQVSCRGDDLGHRWLSAANEVFVEFLEMHPKGMAKNPAYAVPALPVSARVSCSEEPVRYRPSAEVTCPEGHDRRCHAACQMVADCVVENVTVRPIFEPQLPELGFFGDERGDCSDCVSQCESDAAAGGANDEPVLDCLAAAPAACGTGILGALPLTRAVDGCCQGHPDSRVCRRICGAVRSNSTVAPFFPACAAFR